VEASQPIDAAYGTDHVLTILSLHLLHLGNVHRLIEILRNVEFAWSPPEVGAGIENYAESLDTLLDGSGWTIFVEHGEDDVLVSEPKEGGVSEEDME
jgi:hypothetical protein